MTVRIGHASIDENGKASGGAAGDQTGKEVCTRDWYSKPWICVIRPKDSSVAEKIAKAMEQACANDKIGYDQGQRTTLFTQAKACGWDLSKIKTACETDCSALVAVCVNAAGIGVSKDIYTGNEKSALSATGKFDIYTDSGHIASSANLKRGDILLANGHTAIVLSNGANIGSGSSNAGASGTLAVGTVVNFTGTKHYTSADATTPKTCKPGKAKVTSVYAKGKHPYHLVAESGGGSTVYGWVDAADISGASASTSSSFAVGDKVKVTGTIYGNGNGTGGTAKKNGATMYVVGLVDSKTYKHYIGLAATKGGTRVGWAEPSILQKA
jgi:hypothetical protein